MVFGIVVFLVKIFHDIKGDTAQTTRLSAAS